VFVRVKKSGRNEYLQIVESYRENKKPKQRVVATLGRLDQMQDKGEIEKLARSLARFSKKSLLVLCNESNPLVVTKIIGPSLIFERLWKETGISSIIRDLLSARKFEFDVERAIFTTVLHRLINSGSDRNCDYWRQSYKIHDSERLSLHHFYRAMCFLGEELAEEEQTVFSKRRTKDLIEEELFFSRNDIFSGLEMVFFDTTSIHFEGEGGNLGEHGHSKNNRPDLKQMIIAVLINESGFPLCCEMWPGNIADVTTLIPIIENVKKRFKVNNFCIVADRGMISKKVLEVLESPKSDIKYILGVRMRKENDVKKEVLSRTGRYREVYPESQMTKDPSPLKVKEVLLNGKRYIVCLNERQARKDSHDREVIVSSLQDKLRGSSGSLVGNKGYRKYLKVNKQSFYIDYDKIEDEKRFDGKWVLRTNTDLQASEVALRYKELWMVEKIFRDMKSLLDTRPIFHRIEETIVGHVFCSFLSLILLKELTTRLQKRGLIFEMDRIMMDLQALQETTIEENGKKFIIRSDCQGNCNDVFRSVGVAIPPIIREV
jgi:transposase